MSGSDEKINSQDTLEGRLLPLTGDPGQKENIKKENKLVKRLKVIGIWVGAFLAFGLLLFLLGYFLFYRPLRQSHIELEAQAAASQKDLAGKSAEISARKEDIRRLENEVSDLKALGSTLADYNLYLKLMNNLAQMQKAQLYGDPAAMQVGLINAKENYRRLQPIFEAADPQFSALLLERMEQFETSTASAEVIYQEIEVLYVYLLELQETLFGKVY